jgi:hypothetical protein
MLEYQYLWGMLILPLPLFLFFYRKKENRKIMLHSGLFFALLLSLCFAAGKTRHVPEALSFAPGYWHPKTLFDLNILTGGISIEDVLFMFFAGGIAAVSVEFLFGRKIKTGIVKEHHYWAFLFAIVGGYIFYKLTYLNLMWTLIAFNAAGALYIVIARKDLLKHSLVGGIVGGAIYFLLFFLFNLIFPNFIVHNYNLETLVGIYIAGVPLEEILFGISFGLFWSPEIEYEYAIKSNV